MPIPAPIPTPSQPQLNGASVTLNSPITITDFKTADPYAEYVAATTLFIKPGQAYGEGITLGYQMLTGGATPDFGIGCFAARVHAARVAAGQKPGAGQGAEDVWRLLVENHMDVAAVIARIGS